MKEALVISNQKETKPKTFRERMVLASDSEVITNLILHPELFLKSKE